jgi:hypothetical protein
MTTSDVFRGRPAGATGNRSLRIACVYRREDLSDVVVASMDHIRFFRMAAALAGRGHRVDVIVNSERKRPTMAPPLHEVAFRDVRWHHYDVVKTFFHRGFETLQAEGGADHPFIISKLGSVVGRDQTPGVHFYGSVRERLLRTQERIAERSRVVTVLTTPSAVLWRRTHDGTSRLMEVPTGVDADLPALGPNPYPALGVEEPVVLFAGNLYSLTDQAEVNRQWQERLNHIGRALRGAGLRLVAMGPGVTDRLDPHAVLHVGTVPIQEFWDWQRHAAVGIVLAQGVEQDNESSKIYYYLRTALPVVCERPVPNAGLIAETGHGVLVDYGDVHALAAAAAELTATPPPASGVPEYMVRRHSWDARAALYDPVLASVRRAD